MSGTETAGAAANGSNDPSTSMESANAPTTVAPEETNAYGGYELDGDKESDEYDFEEEQQAAEGEDDEFAVGEDDYEDVDGEEDDSGDYAKPGAVVDADDDALTATNGQKIGLTALLLGDPSTAADDGEEDYDEDEDYDDVEDDYVEESTPITPTSKKRHIEETLDDENASPTPEEKGAKKVRA